MRTLRRNILADVPDRLGRLAGPRALRQMRQPDDGKKPQVPHGTGPGALTISRASLVLNRVESAGVLTTNRKVRRDGKTPERMHGQTVPN